MEGFLRQRPQFNLFSYLPSFFKKIRRTSNLLFIKKRTWLGLGSLFALTPFAIIIAPHFLSNGSTNSSSVTVSGLTTADLSRLNTGQISISLLDTGLNSTAGVSQNSSSNSSSQQTVNSSRVVVNGQVIPVPDNGSIQKTVLSADGQNVHVTINNTSSQQGSASSSSNSSTTNVQVNSSHQSEGGSIQSNQSISIEGQ